MSFDASLLPVVLGDQLLADDTFDEDEEFVVPSAEVSVGEWRSFASNWHMTLSPRTGTFAEWAGQDHADVAFFAHEDVQLFVAKFAQSVDQVLLTVLEKRRELEPIDEQRFADAQLP